jgi:YVTN family beta-propeller protein
MRFAVLGSLSVSLDGGRPVSLGGHKQRTLLATLLLHANDVVARDQLIEAVWGECPPPSAAESLDAYLYRLRRLLGRDRLPRREGGYSLRVERDELDAQVFERLVADAGRAADARDHAAVAAMLGDALALWRGAAWVELLDSPLADGEARRLEELRLGAAELRVEAQLALGAGADLVPELEQLALAHPLRERVLSALMLALYRAGRQTDALDAFRNARTRLVDELGLEPGPELHELQGRILRHDPALAAPRRLRKSQASWRGRRLRAAILLAVGAFVATVFVLGAGSASRQPALAAGASGLVGVRPGSGRVAMAKPMGGAPAAVCAGAGSVWVADSSDGTVSRIDPATGVTVDRIPVGGNPASIACGDGAVWVANTDGASVLRLNPTAEAVTQTISLGGANPDALAFGAGRLWVADSSARALYVIDPATATRALRRRVPLDVRPAAIVFGVGAFWVAGYDSATVVKLDPASGRVEGRVNVGAGPDSLAVAHGDLWVANSLAGTVSSVDLHSLKVAATIPVGSGPSAVVADAGSVWVANQYSGSVSRIDPRRDAVESTVDVGGMPTAMTVGGGSLWVGVDASGAGHRGGTLVIASTGTFTSVDPAFYNGAEPPQFAGLAYDTLVTFDHSGGVGGLRLVPDLALTLPTPTNGGRTYAFRLRPGIRYSNGTPLRASDFRRAIERLYRAGSFGGGYFTDIVGAKACVRRPAGCDLARGIVADDASGTLTFHLTAPDPEFLYELTEQEYSAPVPPGTPDRDMALEPIPGTGPYRIAIARGNEVRFVRNRFFHEWSHAAQPDGNPDVILWRRPRSSIAAARAVEDGRADWLQSALPLQAYRQTRIHSPAQLHSHALFSVDFLPFNTNVAPFRSVLVRRALNYAIDRNAIVRMYGGPVFATPACQPLAPGLPGYVRYCPYTLHPSAGGAYSGPDVRQARRLVARSGTRGEHVTVWGSPDEGFVPPRMPFYIASVLRSLGYRTTVRLKPIGQMTEARYSHLKLSTNGDWLVDYPDPTSYIPQFFSCGGSNTNGYVCDPALDRSMQRAAALEHQAPTAANALWTRIDHELTRKADWVPTVNERQVDLVSKRLGGYQFNPVWGFLADQSWIR